RIRASIDAGSAVVQYPFDHARVGIFMKRIIGIAVVLAVVGLLALPKILKTQDAATATVSRSDTLAIDGYVVHTGTLEDRIYTTGSIRANESVDLVSEASGKVTGIFFEEGSAVRKGQLLLKINDENLQAQLDRARVRLGLAQKREQRNAQLLERGGISQDEYDLTQNEVLVLEAEIRVIEAEINRTEIFAPFDGVIGLRYVSEGSFISPQTRIGTLQSLNPIKIDFSVPEKYAGRISPGNEISFRVAGIQQTFRGTIYAVEPSVRQDTRSLQIRAVSRNTGTTLLPGAFADVELLIQRIDNAVTVPSIAVVPELQGQKVFVYRSGRIESQPVETGIRTEEAVQVITGLTPGDTVVVSGIQLVRPGQPVSIAQIHS
ncbi:MAG TPA: efflux RND transporter periplasmic adaptor subunit, partial [Rhodothermales bacterium]